LGPRPRLRDALAAGREQAGEARAPAHRALLAGLLEERHRELGVRGQAALALGVECPEPRAALVLAAAVARAPERILRVAGQLLVGEPRDAELDAAHTVAALACEVEQRERAPRILRELGG